jgi:hypothetical protein
MDRLYGGAKGLVMWKLPRLPFIFFQLAPWPSLNNGGIPAQRAAQVMLMH